MRLSHRGDRKSRLFATSDSVKGVPLNPFVLQPALLELFEIYLELVGPYRSCSIVLCQLWLVGATQADEVVAMASIGLPR